LNKEEKAESGQVPRSIYANQVVGSFGSGMAASSVPVYALRLNASSIDLGWLQAIQNFFPNALQIPWGKLSDRLGRRTPFIIVGTSLAAVAYLMMIASSTALLVILAALFQAIATSAVIPAWSALIGEKIPVTKRGKSLGSIGRWAGLAGIGGSLVTIFIVSGAPPDSSSVFHLLFLPAFVAGLAAALIILLLRERKSVQKHEAGVDPDSGNEDEKLCDFRFFVKTQVFYNFFMSFIWPIMTITQITVLKASNLEVAILSLIGSVATVAVQSQVGKLMDRVGPVNMISASRFMLVVVPLVYGFATSMYHLYVMNLLLGVALAIGNVAFSGYILDIAPPRKRGEYFANFNTAIGSVTFVGSLIGGYMANYLMGFWGLWFGLLVVYIVSFAGRLAGAIWTLKVKECRNYPERMRDVMMDNIPFIRPPP
jgi:DHA1 family multidrug resistance protein-like MFS transporter